MTYVRLKNIDRFIDRHGKPRNYYRAGKGARVALRGQPGSAEFMLAYEAAAQDDSARRVEVRRHGMGDGPIRPIEHDPWELDAKAPCAVEGM